MQLPAETRQLLLKVRRATMDRPLQPARRARVSHCRTTTKPGTLLRQAIPIRSWADSDDALPGYLEVNLVAHCGDSTAGDYLATLDRVALCTGWCECLVPANRGEQAVLAALEQMRQRLSMPSSGIDADNGGEFINKYVAAYCATKILA